MNPNQTAFRRVAFPAFLTLSLMGVPGMAHAQSTETPTTPEDLGRQFGEALQKLTEMMGQIQCQGNLTLKDPETGKNVTVDCSKVMQEMKRQQGEMLDRVDPAIKQFMDGLSGFMHGLQEGARKSPSLKPAPGGTDKL